MTRLSSPSSVPSGSRFLLIGFVLLSACKQVRYREAFYPEGQIDRVVVHSTAGMIQLVPGDQIRVERAIRAPEGALDLSHQVVDGVLELQAECKSIVPCAVDTEIQIPAGVKVEVSLGQGEIWATGIEDLSLELGEGDADVEVTGSLHAQVGTGTVRAAISEGEQARIAVGNGNIDVGVPDGAWDIEVLAAEQDLAQITTQPGARGRLELIAPAGHVTVRTREPVAQF